MALYGDQDRYLMSSREEASDEHQALVLELVLYLEEHKWTVTHAAVEGYESPYEIDDHRCDVIAQDSDGLMAFGEAETCTSLDTPRSSEQIDVFSNRKAQATGDPN